MGILAAFQEISGSNIMDECHKVSLICDHITLALKSRVFFFDYVNHQTAPYSYLKKCRKKCERKC